MIEKIIKLMGKVHMPFSRKLITGKHYYLIRDKINVGTVLLSTTYGESSNLFNPEEMKHGAMYVGNIYGDGIHYVIEATSKGVVLTDLVSFMTSKDEIVVCEPKFLNPNCAVQIQLVAESILGTPYDFVFKDKNKAFYCFEAIAYIFHNCSLNLNLHKRSLGFGRYIYSCETYMKDSHNFDVTWDSRND